MEIAFLSLPQFFLVCYWRDTSKKTFCQNQLAFFVASGEVVACIWIIWSSSRNSARQKT